MRDYGKFGPTWTDFMGRQWPVITTVRRLKFKYPAHAALRAHVFHRDNFKCCLCDACAVSVPTPYTGHSTLLTNTLVKSRGIPPQPDFLVVDHIRTLRAGGKNEIENFQTLCETCNKKKQPHDKALTNAYLKEFS